MAQPAMANTFTGPKTPLINLAKLYQPHVLKPGVGNLSYTGQSAALKDGAVAKPSVWREVLDDHFSSIPRSLVEESRANGLQYAFDSETGVAHRVDDIRAFRGPQAHELESIGMSYRLSTETGRSYHLVHAGFEGAIVSKNVGQNLAGIYVLGSGDMFETGGLWLVASKAALRDQLGLSPDADLRNISAGVFFQQFKEQPDYNQFRFDDSRVVARNMTEGRKPGDKQLLIHDLGQQNPLLAGLCLVLIPNIGGEYNLQPRFWDRMVPFPFTEGFVPFNGKVLELARAQMENTAAIEGLKEQGLPVADFYEVVVQLVGERTYGL